MSGLSIPGTHADVQAIGRATTGAIAGSVAPVAPVAPDRAAAARLRCEVRAGLAARPKTLPPKLLYDECGARLFERICELDEYYLTRAELAIMRRYAGEMAELAGPACALIEYGSGEGLKIRLLLDHLVEPLAYVPIDIAVEQLQRVATELVVDYPSLSVLPVWADYTGPIALPDVIAHAPRRVAYFPGSTVGNFHPDEARAFLSRVAEIVGTGGGLLLGIDLKKDPRVLHAAYNDRDGVTAAFNLNLLRRLNREFGAGFDVSRFRHHAFYDPVAGRVEMHLVSLAAQTVVVDDQIVRLAEGETIWTESCYKYTVDDAARLVAQSGFRLRRAWADEERRFAVLMLET